MPGLAEQLERTLFGERAGELVFDDLANEVLEDRVDELAEPERNTGLSAKLVDVVEPVRERAGLEPREPAEGQMGVSFRLWSHERLGRRSGRSGLVSRWPCTLPRR